MAVESNPVTEAASAAATDSGSAIAMDAGSAQTITFFFAIFALTSILIWGLKKLSAVLEITSGSGTSMFKNILSEPSTQTSQNAEENDTQDSEPKGSFSRLAGAVGAFSIAATFTGMGYWTIYALFYDTQNLGQFDELRWYFLAGSAMFLPYAFNRLSGIFRS